MPAASQIRRLLIANRGEIAVRVARTARSMGIATVAVHSDPDRDAQHVRGCDEAIALGGATAGESYLRGDAIVEAALAVGADAIHPGYGFLSENPAFAEAVVAAGLTWVGPSPRTIATMGDKVAAKRMMRDAGVPVLEDVLVGDSTDLAAAARRTGLPLIVKAAGGGGGKGMRLVEDLAGLEDRVEACRREAAAAFGDDRVFLERFLPAPRHVEVQIMGDRHGTVLHLLERECSIQRRHQKVIEEAPSPVLDAALRAELCDAAVAAGRALGYEGAGTVEFVLGADRTLAFLEVNTRLQVEHPVTELVTGLDLVRLQLLVAEGQALPLNQDGVVSRGHAIEARLYAEDPRSGYLPASGTLHAFAPGGGDEIRWDSGVAAGDAISPYYDPLIAKVIAHAETRTEAARLLERALRTTHLHGPASNRDLLCGVLAHPRFLAGETTTGFLDEHYPTDASRHIEPHPALIEDAAIAAALTAEGRRTAGTTFPSGWRNNRAGDERVAYGGPCDVELGYRAERDDRFAVALGSRSVSVERLAQGDGTITLAIDGRRFTARTSTRTAGREVEWEVTMPHGHVRLTERPRFPEPKPSGVAGATRAPMHGLVTVIAVSEGAAVAKGDVLCRVEAMKMEHEIIAPHAGVVSAVEVRPGQHVDPDAILVVVTEGDGA